MTNGTEVQQKDSVNQSSENSPEENITKIQIDTIFSNAFDRIKGFKGTYWKGILIVILAYIPIIGLNAALEYLANGGSFMPPESMTGIGYLLLFFSQMSFTFLVGPLTVGLCILSLKRIRNEQTNSGEVLNHFNKIVPLFFTTILMYFFVILGFALFIFPGIYLAIAYIFSTILVVDKNLSPWQALETSRKAVTKQWFRVLVCLLGAGLFFFISMIPLGIGVIWSLPWNALLFALLYQKLFDDIDVESQQESHNTHNGELNSSI